MIVWKREKRSSVGIYGSINKLLSYGMCNEISSIYEKMPVITKHLQCLRVVTLQQQSCTRSRFCPNIASTKFEKQAASPYSKVHEYEILLETPQ